MNRARLFLKATLLGLCIALSLVGCSTPSATRTTAADGSGSAADLDAAGSNPMVVGIKAEDAGRQTRIVISGNQPLTYTAALRDVPPSIVVDIGAGAGEGALGLTQIKSGMVESVDLEAIEGTGNAVRARINLAQATTYQVVRENRNLVVLVENAGAPADEAGLGIRETPLTPEQMKGGTARVTSVEFKPVGRSGRTRLVIRTDRLATPQILTRDGGKTVIMSISPAVIGGEQARPLNTTYFRSSVNYIKASQAAGRSVRVTIRLRSMVPYHLGQKGLVTYLDFDPSSVAPKRVDLSRVRPGAPAAPGAAAAPGAEEATDEKASMTSGRGYNTSPGQEGSKYSGQKISLDFQNADIHNILRLIGEVSGKNVVVSDQVTGKVTLKLTEVPWDHALDIVLASQKLGLVESGNVLRIDLAENLRQEKELLIQEQAKDADAAKLTPLAKKIFTPKYAAVDQMEEDMTKLLTDRGKLTVIGNDIYVEDTQATLSSMEEVFLRIDRVAKQILIESRIVEATDEFIRAIGVNWGNHYNGSTETTGPLAGNTWNLYGATGGAAGAGGTALNLISPPAAGLALGFGLISDRLDLDAKLYAYEKTTETRIVSAPRILAGQDEEVYIRQGQEVPFESSGTTTTPATVEYKDAVLELRVTPHIEENGKIITMDILVTKDQPGAGRNPSISTREAKTKLMVKNGETVVIGGILDDTQSKEVNRVPGLHRIPILGWLFKSHDVTDRKIELLIFLTANIIPLNI